MFPEILNLILLVVPEISNIRLLDNGAHSILI